MIGVYDYTVVLTYLSLLSGCLGIAISLSGGGYLGIFFLLFCGLCDAFDGKVAGTKKNRSSYEKNFGIQIDSLSDLVAFGVLPACIGVAIYRNSLFLHHILGSSILGNIVFSFVLLSYVLCAMIRLAHFNVTEEERQKVEEGVRKYYTGLPVTSAAIIFPSVVLLQYLLPGDFSLLYFVVAFLMAFLFIFKFRLKKLDMKGIFVLVLLGVIEFSAFILFKFMR